MKENGAVRLVDFGERPDLAAAADALVTSNLPPFVTWASPGNWRWHLIHELFPTYQLAALDSVGSLIAAAHSVPVNWQGDRSSLPGGFDDVLVAATSERLRDRAGGLCLLSISVRPDRRRTGLTRELVREMRRRAEAFGCCGVLAPLRPTRKADHPLVPMEAYLTWRTEAGDIYDPWLRQHVALGAEILGVAERSLVVRQPVARWEKVADFRMPRPAAYTVEGALVPVEIDARGTGTYVEPNVWIYYRTGT